jgi:hypothetical protein
MIHSLLEETAMRKCLPVLFLFTLCAVSMPAQAEDAQTILQKVEELQHKRLEGIAGYTVDATIMGQRQITMYERTPVTVDGKTAEVFRRVSPGKTSRRGGGQGQAMTPAQLEAFADAQESTGDALSDEMDQGMQQAGLPKGLLGALGAGSAGEPWASADPRIMMGGNAGFLRAAANAERANAAEAASLETDQGHAEFAGKAKLLGTGNVDGIAAFHLVADNLDRRQALEDGGELVIDTVSLWIDRKMYVPLKLTMQGTLSMQGQTRKIQIEKLNSDYREVEGSSMYESYRQVMRMGGVMAEKDRKEMQKAQSELAELEKKIAAMPQSQRAMMEKMIGSQFDTIRKMASGGALEVVTEVNNILVDTGSPGRD